VAGFALAVASPEQQQQQQNEDVGDSRTFKLKALMRKRFDENPEISFQSFTTGVRSTKAFVNTFYHLLILASAGQLRFEQPEPYGDISITKTISF
jgi:chromatin segregation and condensation protein Rec8/ScpA/Scc1 (kleisin family)